MAANEYVLGLLAIVSGLAITEWIGSFYRLLAARRSVRWDWLAFIVAIFAVYNILYSWWVSWRSFGPHPQVSLTLGVMAIDLLEVAFMFIAARASLPEAVPEGGVDLKAHYASNSWLIWGGMAAGPGLLLAQNLVYDWHKLFTSWRLELAILAAVLLALFRQRPFHRLLAPVVVVAWIALTVGWRMGA